MENKSLNDLVSYVKGEKVYNAPINDRVEIASNLGVIELLEAALKFVDKNQIKLMDNIPKDGIILREYNGNTVNATTENHILLSRLDRICQYAAKYLDSLGEI